MNAPRDIDSTVYEQIGRVMVRWAYVEALVGQFLVFLIGADAGYAVIVTQNVSGSTLTEWMRALYRHRFSDPETVERLGMLFDRIDELRATRNVFAHGLWEPGPENGTGTAKTIKWERREVIQTRLVTPQDFAEALQEIEETGAELLQLGDRLGFHPQAKT